MQISSHKCANVTSRYRDMWRFDCISRCENIGETRSQRALSFLGGIWRSDRWPLSPEMAAKVRPQQVDKPLMRRCVAGADSWPVDRGDGSRYR